jgi:hypothetical protein
MADAAQMTVDVAVTLGNDASRISDYFNKLGEALEALGGFSKAAQIYEQATTLCFNSFSKSATLHANSGLAHRRAGDCASAEKKNVATLHYCLSYICWQINMGHQLR